MHVCTIIARNYLPQARVLAETFQAVHPGGRVTVLVVDETPAGAAQLEEPFEVMVVDDLIGDAADLKWMPAIYDILEFSTAIKPWLLRTLLAREPAVVYLDPDIQVFSTIATVEKLLATHPVALTPHVTAPMPRDGKKAGERTILASGIYNLGFIAVRRDATAFLDFWAVRLRRDCLIQHEQMHFVDQRWIDFAPAIFDTEIIRDPTFNVAYWNLDHRRLTWTPSGYFVTGAPLRFFHFSGYNPRKRHLLSKHQMPQPRILLSEHPTVRRICNEYGALLEEHGFVDCEPAGASYRFAHLANGVPVDRHVRAMYRRALLLADEDRAAYPPDPFSADTAEATTRWMNGSEAPPGRANRTTRYLAAVHEGRPDLQAAFPDPNGYDYTSYVEWARREAAQSQLDPRLVPELPTSVASPGDVTVPQRWAPPDRLRPGMTVVGYLKAELGIGEAGRLTVQAIEEAKIPCASLVTAGTSSRQDHPYRTRRVAVNDFDTHVIAVNGDRLPEVRAEMGEEAFRGRYTIGQWAWELEEFPARWCHAFGLVDEIWTYSEFARAAIAAVSTKPVYSCPPAIVPPPVREPVGRRALGLPERRFMYLFAFDLFSVLERKNPLGLIEAFKRAFPREDSAGPVLVLKVINGDHRVADLELLRFSVSERSDISIIDRYMTVDDQAALMAATDCYVSLHRSEGFGLTMGEAMALGKPVVATGYSGNLDYMNEDTALLVNWDYMAIPEGCDPYDAGVRWAEPDVDHAAHLLRFVYEHPAEARCIGERARRYVLAEHGLAARASFIRRRFDEIQELRSRMIASHALVARSSVPFSGETLTRLAAGRPSLDAPAARLPRLTRLYRRGVLRAQRHRDDHQRHVNVGLASAIADLQQLVGQLHRASADLGESAAAHGAELTELSLRIGRLARSEHLLGVVSSQLSEVEAGIRKRLTEQDVAIRGVHELANRDATVMSDLGDKITVLGQRVAGLQEMAAEVRSVPYMADPSELLTEDDLGRTAIGYRLPVDGARATNDYASFEDIFRGPEELVRDRQRVYLPLLSGHEPVLDAGCGRGEMLDLLNLSDIEAIGVDVDGSMIERCRLKGHKVELANVVTYLKRQADESVGAVFSAQVIEHLTYDDLLCFLSETHRVLVSGGILIAETVNPHAVPAFKTFWTDPTHKAPIFPEVATVLCRIAGFDETLVTFPNGTGELEVDRWRTGEFAVVAKKLCTARSDVPGCDDASLVHEPRGLAVD